MVNLLLMLDDQELQDELCTLHNSKQYVNNKQCHPLQEIPKKNWIIRRVNILSYIKTYDKSIAISDAIAGFTLGLTIIPQSIAYASLAGLPSQYGLYAAFMGAFVYVIFGTIKEVSIGPTSLMALLTLQYTFNKPPEFTIILAFLAGLVELIMGLLNIGFLIDFISDPVTSAFTSATAIIVILSQCKNLLGIEMSSKGIVETVYQVILRITETRLGDTLLGIFCIIFLLLFRQLNLIKIKKSRTTLKKLLWYLSICRNAFVVVITSFLAYLLSKSYEMHDLPIHLSKEVEPGIPMLQLPPFIIVDGDVTYSFVDILKELGSGIFVVPIVGMLANIAIAKAFATHGNLDASQEMFALGLCNIIGSFFKGIPTCGAFTRSAVSNASGVRTPIAGIYSGILVLLSLSLFTPYFKYIPKSTLAAVLICAVVFMIDFSIIKKLYKESKRDLIGWIGCFFTCLALGVEVGLLCGIGISLTFMLIKIARPKIHINRITVDDMEYIYVEPTSDVFYTSMDYIRTNINAVCSSLDYKLPVVINCNRISELDYTSIKVINSLANDFNQRNVLLIFQNIQEELQEIVQNSCNSNTIQFCNNLCDVKIFHRN